MNERLRHPQDLAWSLRPSAGTAWTWKCAAYSVISLRTILVEGLDSSGMWPWAVAPPPAPRKAASDPAADAFLKARASGKTAGLPTKAPGARGRGRGPRKRRSQLDAGQGSDFEDEADEGAGADAGGDAESAPQLLKDKFGCVIHCVIVFRVDGLGEPFRALDSERDFWLLGGGGSGGCAWGPG